MNLGKIMGDFGFLFFILLFSRIFVNKNDFRIKKGNKDYFKIINRG